MISKTIYPILLFSIISIYAGLSHANANPTVCFKTDLGGFCLELFADQTPNTVNNFLNYLKSGAYNRSVIHRSVPGFVIQGGGFQTVDELNFSAIATFDPVANEPAISNTRGTIAMAKVADDPDSATSQWFINLADNSTELDNNNGGYTVFGQVIGTGMRVVDKIAALPISNLSSVLGTAFSAVPIINYDGLNFTTHNFLTINEVEIIDTEPVATFHSDNGLTFNVDTGAKQPFNVTLNLIASSPDIIFQVDSLKVNKLTGPVDNPAIFSASTGILTIPSVLVNDSTLLTNVSMSLTDAEHFQFTVSSSETPKVVGVTQ